MADNPTYETTYYCLQAETGSEKIIKYTADSYSPLTPIGVVKVDGTHLQITFDRELEYATTITTRDGGSGISMVGTQACSKFTVEDNGTNVGVFRVVPLASPTGADGRRTFRTVEVELEKTVSDSAMVSYDPELKGHNDSLALADPNAGKLTGAFGSVSAAAPQAQLKTLALDAAVSGQNDGTLMDENTPTEPTRMFEESLADDKVSSVVMTFTLDKESDWSVSVNGAAPNPGATAAKGSVNVGLKEGWNRITLTVGDVSQLGFVTYEIWLYKGTPAYTPVTSITLESESGEHFDTITPADGYLQYYASIPGSCRSVVVKVAAKDDPQSIEINDEIADQDGKVTLSIPASGYTYSVKITVTGKNGETASYIVELNSRNNDMKLSDLKVYKVTQNGSRTELTLKYRSIGNDPGGEGFKQDLKTEGGWRYYYVDLNSSIVAEKCTFVVVPTVEANMAYGTDIFVGLRGGSQPQPIESGKDSKGFSIGESDQNLPISITMSRKNPQTGNPDVSDYKVQINLISNFVTPQLESLTLHDICETEDVLTLSQPELGAGERTFRTKPNSLNFTLHAQIPNDPAIMLDTNLDRDKDSCTISEGKVTARINLEWGEKRTIRFTVKNMAIDQEYEFKLNLQQGYEGKFIYLGVSPEYLSHIWLDGAEPEFTINEMSSYTQFEPPTEPGGNRKFTNVIESYVFKKRYKKLNTDGGNSITVNWSVCPPIDNQTGLLNFKLASVVSPDETPTNWKIGTVTVNPRGTGGTVELIINTSVQPEPYYREYSYTSSSEGGKGEVDRVHPVYLQAELPDGRMHKGIFAHITTREDLEFPDIIINEYKKQDFKIIEFNPVNQRPPITDCYITGGYAGDHTNDYNIKTIQVGAVYQFKITIRGRTYGDYRRANNGEFAKTYPRAVLNPNDWLSIAERLEVYKQHFPGTKDDAFDGYYVDYSHDPITWTLVGDGELFSNPNDVSEYATIDQNGVVTTRKAFPADDSSSRICVVARTSRNKVTCKANFIILPERASDVSVGTNIPYIALSPRAAFYGYKKNYNSSGGGNDDPGWKHLTDVWNMNSSNGYGDIRWSALSVKGGSLRFSGNTALGMKLVNAPKNWYEKSSGSCNFAPNITNLDALNKRSGWEETYHNIPKNQSFLAGLANFIKKEFEGTDATFNGPHTLPVSGVSEHQSISDTEHGLNTIENNYVYLTQEGRVRFFGKSSAFNINTIMALRGAASEDLETVQASERGRWDYEERTITKEEQGTSEDIVLYKFSDGRTGVSCIVDLDSAGTAEETKTSGKSLSRQSSSSVMAAANEIEWIYPDMPGAEDISITYGDGTPVSSDSSLYYDNIMKLSRSVSTGVKVSRGAVTRPKLAPIKMNFAVDSEAFDNLELLSLNYKMKNSDEVYTINVQGTSTNGGFSFSDAAEDKKQDDPAANSGGGSGCNGGFAGLLALFAVVLPLCAIRRGRS